MTTAIRAARSDSVLQVDQLAIGLTVKGRNVPIVHDVSVCAQRGRITGIVGETGSGKTMSMLAVFGLLPRGARVSGTIRFLDMRLEPGGMSRSKLLGNRMTMVFQDARSSLHPTVSIGRQMERAVRRTYPSAKRRERRDRVKSLLARVGLRASEDELKAYPFQFSGGMCQRVAIALALARNPDLVVADEPTSALDATIQLQIADLLDDLVHTTNLSCILITHDIRLVGYLSDEIAVFKDGRVVERGEATSVIENPRHAYTRLLLEAGG